MASASADAVDEEGVRLSGGAERQSGNNYTVPTASRLPCVLASRVSTATTTFLLTLWWAGEVSELEVGGD